MTSPTPDRTPDQIAIDMAIRIGFLGLFAWLSLSLVAPFAIIVIWAVILAVAVYPIFDWLRARLGGRSGLAATLVTLSGLAIIFGPTGALVSSLLGTIDAISTGLKEGTLAIRPPGDRIAEIPVIGPSLHKAWGQVSGNLTGFIQANSERLLQAGGWLLGAAAGLLGGVLAFAASVVIAGFLFGPGPKLASGARAFAARVAGARGHTFIDLAGATIRNVSQGVIGIAILQSLLLGIGMVAVGVPAAGLLAFAALLLSIIQIGPGLIVIGVLIWAWTSLGTITALIFTIYMIAAGLSDNVLKPVIMSKGLPTPMLVILIGVIGGTLAYGLLGLFLGPIVLAVFYELLVEWVRAETPVKTKDTAVP